MLQHIIKVGSFLLVTSGYISTIHVPSLKQITIKKVAELIVRNANPNYCSKALDTLSSTLDTTLVQHLLQTYKERSILPLLLLSYKRYQQQQNTTNQPILCLLLSDNKQVPLTSNQSKELIQRSTTIQNLIHDIDIQDAVVHAEEIPLPLLTHEQVTTLLSYISGINALNISDSILPVVQQEIPEAKALSSYYLKYTALQQLKESLEAHTIPTLCNLIIAASYLAIHNNEYTVNFIELATQALASKLIQSPIYQDEYNVINMLPQEVKKVLVYHLIDNSTLRYALCSNSTDVIVKTAQTLTNNDYNSVNSVSWSPNGSTLATSSYKTIKIWNTNNSSCINTLHDNSGWIAELSWSRDGSKIVSSSGNRTIRIWNITTGNCIHELTGHTDKVTSVSWSPDGKYIASSSDDNTIRIWDAVTGTCIYTLKGHTDHIRSVSWSPNGNYIASCSIEKIVRIWNITTGTYIHTLTGHTDWVNSVVWSPDNKYIASGSDDKTIKIWDAQSGTCIHTLVDHTAWITSVAWSPNSKYIASGTWDGTIRIWNTTTNICIHTLKNHTSSIWSISWSPDGIRLSSGSDNGTVMVWSIINKELNNNLKNILSWEQALLLIRISNQHDIDFVQDTKACYYYVSLPEEVKQLIEPLLSKSTRTTLVVTLDENVLHRDKRIRICKE